MPVKQRHKVHRIGAITSGQASASITMDEFTSAIFYITSDAASSFNVEGTMDDDSVADGSAVWHRVDGGHAITAAGSLAYTITLIPRRVRINVTGAGSLTDSGYEGIRDI